VLAKLWARIGLLVNPDQKTRLDRVRGKHALQGGAAAQQELIQQLEPEKNQDDDAQLLRQAGSSEWAASSWHCGHCGFHRHGI
jgi:hypothetical protein